jgi:hypothetical protein
MVTSIFPHNGEAASADSTLEYVGSFEPTGFEPVVVQFARIPDDRPNIKLCLFSTEHSDRALIGL